jgi:hypothetical protein
VVEGLGQSDKFGRQCEPFAFVYDSNPLPLYTTIFLHM